MPMKTILEAEEENLKLAVYTKNSFLGSFYNFVLFETDEETGFSYIKATICLTQNILFTNHQGETFWNTHTSAAESGYGPLIYDIAFSWVQKQQSTSSGDNAWIMSDRSQVSKAAKRVWKKFFELKNKYEARKANVFYKGSNSNKNYLNYCYKIKQPLDYSKLEKNYQDFIKTKKKNQKKFETFLGSKISRFFAREYVSKGNV